MPVTVWILGDQLTNPHPALKEAEDGLPRSDITILMIESRQQAHRMPYHFNKLVLLFSAMRHYAEALRAQGYQVDYRVAENVGQAITDHWKVNQPNSLFMMAASSLRGRTFQQNLSKVLGIQTKLLPNSQFISSVFDHLPDFPQDKPVRQEQFYRKIRQHFGLLIDDHGQPVGGQWNYDAKNQQALPKSLTIPKMISFEPDLMTQQVMAEVNQSGSFTGTAAGFDLAVTHDQAQTAVEDFLQHRLPFFGTYEDAMRQSETVIFHSKLSPYINIGLIEPLALAEAAERCYFEGSAQINNVEGFIRQVIGWREYMFWQYQRLMPNLAEQNYWRADRQLPAFFWQGDTKMNCLAQVIKRVLETGYAHHIERLMVLANFCLLCGVHPEAVHHWFMCAFIDAYEWVMTPNVYGMGLYADGGQIGSKPYVASANYINKMSDYCLGCHFDKNKRTGELACPFNFLYWNFLLRHQAKLQHNYRMARMLHNLKFLDGDEKIAVQDQAQGLLEDLDG